MTPRALELRGRGIVRVVFGQQWISIPVPTPWRENCFNPGAQYDAQSRSRRREEAEGFANRVSPPRYLGGYARELHGEVVAPACLPELKG